MTAHRQTAGCAAAQGLPKMLTLPIISSLELMGGGNEVIIEHAGEQYRLRITRQEKLILTK